MQVANFRSFQFKIMHIVSCPFWSGYISWTSWQGPVLVWHMNNHGIKTRVDFYRNRQRKYVQKQESSPLKALAKYPAIFFCSELLFCRKWITTIALDMFCHTVSSCLKHNVILVKIQFICDKNDLQELQQGVIYLFTWNIIREERSCQK